MRRRLHGKRIDPTVPKEEFDVTALRITSDKLSSSPSKVSLCTSWQRYVSARDGDAYSKDSALLLWQAKTHADKQVFKAALASFLELPLPDAIVVKTEPKAEIITTSTESPASSLIEFNDRYQSVLASIGMSRQERSARAQRENHARNRMYSDVCHLVFLGQLPSIRRAVVEL